MSERSAAESRSESDSDGERAVRDELAGAEPCDTMSAPRPITLGERAAALSSDAASATEGGEASGRSAAESRSESDSVGE